MKYQVTIYWYIKEASSQQRVRVNLTQHGYQLVSALGKESRFGTADEAYTAMCDIGYHKNHYLHIDRDIANPENYVSMKSDPDFATSGFQMYGKPTTVRGVTID